MTILLMRLEAYIAGQISFPLIFYCTVQSISKLLLESFEGGKNESSHTADQFLWNSRIDN